MKACVVARAELLVTKRVPPGGSVSSATPVDFAPDGAASVVALVSGGPHSGLAARVANWLGESLAWRRSRERISGSPEERDSAQEVLERIGPEVPSMETRVVEAWTAKQLLDEMDDDALLVSARPADHGFSECSWVLVPAWRPPPGRRRCGQGTTSASVPGDGGTRVRQSAAQRLDALLVSELSAIRSSPLVAWSVWYGGRCSKPRIPWSTRGNADGAALVGGAGRRSGRGL